MGEGRFGGGLLCAGPEVDRGLPFRVDLRYRFGRPISRGLTLHLRFMWMGNDDWRLFATYLLKIEGRVEDIPPYC
jgi:hypothetical protein